MNTFKSLIKLSKQNVDEKRRLVTEAEEGVHFYKSALTAHTRRHETSLETARNNLNVRANFQAFLQKSKLTQDNLQLHLNSAIFTLAEKRKDLQIAFEELKKYEKAYENQLAREKAEQDRKEQAFADEIGLQGFRRKKR